MSKEIQSRPARVQVDPDDFEEENLPPQTGTVFNIWYNKWSGGASGSTHQIVKSKYKLNVDKDSGYTKADKASGQPYFCLYFAKGMCIKGKKCEYLHRIPTDFDIFPVNVDCFGREKFSDYRDDMNGVGSFTTVNTTLYIGGLTKITSKTQILLNERFSSFGKIKKINLINAKNCAFVSYKNEQNAQFAKEAMLGQSLYDDDNVLVVKWANEDPNPHAVKLKKRELEQETEKVVQQLLGNFEKNSKRAKIEENNEPIVEEPEESPVDQVKETKAIAYEQESNETKQQNVEQNSSIFKNTSLNYLSLLKTKAVPKPTSSLVNDYESDDEDD